jgi:hypothetical protein
MQRGAGQLRPMTVSLPNLGADDDREVLFWFCFRECE